MKSQQFPLLVRNFPFLLYYRGNYKIDLSPVIFEIVNNNLTLNFERSFVTRLSYLVVECIQNIYRYSESEGSSEDYCLVYSDQKYCHIMTRNLIATSKVKGLRNRLEEVRNKTIEEINVIYRNVLRSDSLTSKGAGLGILDIARKTGKRMDYEFLEISESQWQYLLHLKLPLPEKENPVSIDDKKADEIIRTVLEEFDHNENTLLYSGDFSNTFLNNILNLITQQYENEKKMASSVFKYALIEFIQNIKRHATKSENGAIEAFLAIEWLREQMILSTSNFISEENAKKLGALLGSLKKSVQIGLRNTSDERMNDENVQGGLGLVDIARLSWPRFIEYSIHSYENSEKSIDLSIKFDYER